MDKRHPENVVVVTTTNVHQNKKTTVISLCERKRQSIIRPSQVKEGMRKRFFKSAVFIKVPQIPEIVKIIFNFINLTFK